MNSSSMGSLSKEFFELVKSIGESRSKSEEDAIISKEARILKQKLAEKGGPLTADNKRKKELLIRLMYVELLGHDASFGYVHAVQMTASQDLAQKRVGYLCCALFLAPDHDLRFMLINQLNRDLQSTNMLEVAAALVAVCKLLTVDSLPALLPTITELLKHEQNVVRKKAVMALHRCYQISPDAISHLTDSFRRVLCDKDPSVMGASLCLLHDLAKVDPNSHKDLVPSYVSILKQITEHRLPREFDYHRIPAPWIQIKLLQILAILGRNDQLTSEGMYAVIHECMRRADTGINIGHAIIYECVRTVTTIYPNTALLDAAANAISRFITSENHNLKYLGVTGLGAIVRDHPRYAAQHQVVVLDCLEDPDETLKRKTLDLLFKMTNPANAEVIVAKLLHFLSESRDKYLRADLVSRITQLADRYSPDNVWYVQTMTSVFEVAGDLVPVQVPHSLLRLLAEGAVSASDEDTSDADTEMRTEACETFASLLEKPSVPDVLLRVMFWTLGEYAFLLGLDRLPEIIAKICDLIKRPSIASLTQSYGISACLKMTAQLGTNLACFSDVVHFFDASIDTDLQQRCFEVREIVKNPALTKACLPVDASCEDLSEMDLSFLDQFVAEKLAQGAASYSLPESLAAEDAEENDKEDDHDGPSLRYDAYDTPTMPDPAVFAGSGNLAASNSRNGSYDEEMEISKAISASLSTTTNDTTTNGGGLQLSGVKNVWGQDGYTGSIGGGSLAQLQQQQLAAIAQSTSRLQEKTLSSSSSSLSNNSTANNTTSKSKTTLVADITPNYDMYDDEDEETNDNSVGRGFTNSVDSDKVISKPPAEPSERDKMAAALFGGLGGAAGSSTSSTSSRSRVRTRTSQTGASPAQKPNIAQAVDLLGFTEEDLTTTTTTTTSSSSSSQRDASLDSLAMSSTTPGPSTANQTSSSDSVLDLLSGLDLSTTSKPSLITVPTPPPTAAIIPILSPVTGVTTQIFGSQWAVHTAEQRVAIPSLRMSLPSINECSQLVSSRMGAAVVEVIPGTQEAILIGSTPGLPIQGATVLIHCKRRPAGDALDCIVRSTRPQETQRVVLALNQILS